MEGWLPIIAGIAIGFGFGTFGAWRWILKPKLEPLTKIEKSVDQIRKSRQAQLYEKVAMLYSYQNNVSEWEDRGLDIGPIIDRIKADLQSVHTVQNMITDKQQSDHG